MTHKAKAMDARTLEALKGSIEKWEKIVAGTGTDYGPDNCSLCRVFIDDDCKGCPVRDATGTRGCDETPYIEYNRVARYDGIEAALPFAREELAFLKGLLP